MRKKLGPAKDSEREGSPGVLGVPGPPAGEPAPSPRRAPADPARRARRGAPKGNKNALKHGAFSERMLAARKATGNLRDTHRRRGENEARAILSGLGLAKSPLARLVARQVGRLEAMISRLESFHASRGHFTREGILKASVKTEVETVDRILGEARRLLEQLGERGTADGRDVVYKVQFHYTRGVNADGKPAYQCLKCGYDPTTLRQSAPAPAVAAQEAPGAAIPAASELEPSSAPDASEREPERVPRTLRELATEERPARPASKRPEGPAVDYSQLSPRDPKYALWHGYRMTD